MLLTERDQQVLDEAALHALESEQVFYNTLFIQVAQGQQVDQQKVFAQIAELNEKKKLINIEYQKIRDKSRITLRDEIASITWNPSLLLMVQKRNAGNSNIGGVKAIIRNNCFQFVRATQVCNQPLVLNVVCQRVKMRVDFNTQEPGK